MNIAIRNGDRAAIQAAADDAAKLMTALVAKTETGMDFMGVMPSLGKRMKAGVQEEPIAADGLDKLTRLGIRFIMQSFLSVVSSSWEWQRPCYLIEVLPVRRFIVRFG